MIPTADQDARRTTIEGRDRSLFVEASAGTGKTHAIIEAIVEVCARRQPRTALTRVVAVTFTEKAAGELQQRLRLRLTELAASAKEDPIRLAALESLEEIDRAQVGTIHAFCSSLLRERPIEAGVVPDFRMLMPEASAALARSVWEEWWRQEVSERPDGPVGRALRSGIRIAGGDKEFTLRALADRIYEERAKIEDAVLPDADAATVLETARRLGRRAEELRERAQEARNPAAETLAEIVRWLSSLPDDLEGIRETRPWAPKIKFKSGWKEEAIDRWRKKEYEPFLESLDDTVWWPMLVDLLRRLVDDPASYLAAVAKRKRRESLLDFDDLLLTARDLLRRSAAARGYFRQRYSLLIVDEFQDTDPLQMEILLRLAHSEGGGEDWTKLAPQPGRLLVVGDPKQSIYRFRRADLETYTLVRDLLAADRQAFTANRRSVAPLLEWINTVFSEVMAPPVRPFEAPYSPIEPAGNREIPDGRRILYLDPPADWRSGEKKWRKVEASSIAAFLADAVEKKTIPVEGARPAGPGDVAILVRSNEAIGYFQEALAEAGLDAVIEGGLDFFRREEPAAVLSALQSIDNPEDKVALYASLKSFLFALSDEDLFLAREEGAAFDYRRASLATGPVREALDLLERLHRERENRPASETLLELFAATEASVKARSRRLGGLQAQANLHQVVSLARELEGNASSFGAVVRGLAAIGKTDASEPRAFEESTDAVRILTVHRAKGLEFPIVVLAGFGAEGKPQSSDGFLAPTRKGPWGISLKLGADTVGSPGFVAIREADDERDKAETLRLLYVGATRARDWFLLSRWRKVAETSKGASDSFDRTVLARLGPKELSDPLARLVEVRSIYPKRHLRPARDRRSDSTSADELRRELARIERRPEVLGRSAHDSLRRAGESVATAEDPPWPERDTSAPSVAARVGSAVHRAMELVVRGSAPDAAVVCAALECGLEPRRQGEVAAMVATLLGSPLLFSPGRRTAEVPILFRSSADGALVEGKIDLLLEEAGGFTIVDYKTDRLDGLSGSAAILEHFGCYRPQLEEYRNALAL
ncbi:MAG: UvrD-helicase domain-containing protein, partial [Thermoanaerobaculia bacterium]